MTTTNQTYHISELNLIDGSFERSNNWDDLIMEGNGGFVAKNQYIVFDSLGVEVVIDFELLVTGRVSHDPGDWWNPPYTDVDVDDIEIDINSIHIDDCEVELTQEVIDFFTIEVKKNL